MSIQINGTTIAEYTYDNTLSSVAGLLIELAVFSLIFYAFMRIITFFLNVIRGK